VKFLGVTGDVRGYAYWNFDHEQMIPVMQEWHAGNATVSIKSYQQTFLMLKQMISRQIPGRYAPRVLFLAYYS
jgi:hypothetical protein